LETRVEVGLKPGVQDAAGAAIEAEIRDLGIPGVEGVRLVHTFLLEGEIGPDDAQRIARTLLTDPVTERFAVDEPLPPPEAEPPWHEIKVIKKPGVMDPVGESAEAAIRHLGITITRVRTARRYLVAGKLAPDDLRRVGERVLSNPLIETVLHGDVPFPGPPTAVDYRFSRVEIPIRDADDARLLEIDRTRRLSLNLEELRTIRRWFVEANREPTDVELDTLAQTWSEHCKHKTLAGSVVLEGRSYENLLKETIMQATGEIDAPWCVSVFRDNAGVIRFDDDWDVCFKVETHNHPSALEPYGGAGTGIGGVIRDILGTGLGARPFLNTDVFCFGPLDFPPEEVPRGVLHPRRVVRGVVAGVRDYGNRMGIPTASGAVLFDPRYLGNPLVYCGTLGLLPADCAAKGARAGDRILVVGGRTGRDGIGGATFSSTGLTTESETVSSGAVQIGNPIMEKKVLDTLLQARDRRLYRSVTDCGAGGLSSAIGEMGEELGASVELARVPLKYRGLSYGEIWLSEAQERMVLAVPPENEEAILRVFAEEDVEATVLGAFTSDKRLKLTYGGEVVCDLDMEFLHHGLPKTRKTATIEARIPSGRAEDLDGIPPRDDLGPDLLRVLASPNLASKEWIIRQYDHEVQGGLVVKPLQGAHHDGPGDAVVVTPVLGSRRGVAVSNGINPRYGDLDPYWMAASAIDEALRNLVAVGCPLDRTALLDNFSWGNTERPEALGALVRAAEACRDFALAFRSPFISGKDSLNNEFVGEGETIAIPHTLLISALGVVEDVRRCVTMDLKRAGSPIYLVGLTHEELGGSHYLATLGRLGRRPPRVDPNLAPRTLRALAAGISAGGVRACHDLSEGGLGAAAAEMCLAGSLGMEIALDRVPVVAGTRFREDVLLFSESNTRFLVEVAPEAASAFERRLSGVSWARIGSVTEDGRLRVRGIRGLPVVDEPVETLRRTWREAIPW